MENAPWVVLGFISIAVVVVILGAVASGAASDSSVATAAPFPTSETQPIATASPSQPSPTGPAAAPTSLAAMLDRLEVVPEHLDGYDRDLFPHWTDADGDGCNTRYEVLITEAVVAPSIAGSCDLTGGTWLSPFDGVEIEGASEVQIDHLVALAESWYSGAHGWTTERRERFANDLDVPWALTAVSPAINEAKGASDPAEWLPPEPAAVCPYLEAWIGMKVRWSLTINPVEEAALVDLVRGCPESRITVPVAD